MSAARSLTHQLTRLMRTCASSREPFHSGGAFSINISMGSNILTQVTRISYLRVGPARCCLLGLELIISYINEASGTNCARPQRVVTAQLAAPTRIDDLVRPFKLTGEKAASSLCRLRWAQAAAASLLNSINGFRLWQC